MVGWTHTATPQPCVGCGNADQMVHALTRRCLDCNRADAPPGSRVRRIPVRSARTVVAPAEAVTAQWG